MQETHRSGDRNESRRKVPFRTEYMFWWGLVPLGEKCRMAPPTDPRRKRGRADGRSSSSDRGAI